MAYATGLRLDRATEEIVIDIWRQLSDAEFATQFLLDGYFPHISMALSETLNIGSFVDEISSELQTVPKVQVQFSSVSLFTKPEFVLFYGITPTNPLLHLHSASFEVYQKHATELNPLYRPDGWVPHCSLAVGIGEDKIKAGIDIARTLTLPLSVPSLEFVVVEHDGRRAEIITSFPL